MDYLKEIKEYVPYNDQERVEKDEILKYTGIFDNLLTRDNTIAHFTASCFTVNQTRDKVLMAYHNIYNTWSWTGGHVDGESNFLEVALREVKEETGVTDVKAISKEIFSLEILPVAGHYKNGKRIATHLHLNVTYLLQAEEGQYIRIKPDENKGVMWIPLNNYKKYCTEETMYPIYDKIIAKIGNIR